MIFSKILNKISSKEPPEAISWWINHQLTRLNLVTREEFDIQQAVLLKTRSKLEALEKELSALYEMSRSTNPQDH